MDSESSTTIQDIIEFDKYQKILKYQSQWYSAPFGYMIENLSSDPKVTLIDKNESPFDPPNGFFYNHELCMWTKCLLSETGVVTENKETDRNGVNLDRTGASGDVMTWIPNGQCSYKWEPDADVQIFKFAPYYSNHRGFDYHPNCYQGGGTKHDHFFWGTYPAGLKDDAGTLKFNSWSGVQPWTGDQMRAVPFTAGNTEFTVGETITGFTSGATGTVVSWHKSSGDWTATPGTAAGTVYIRNYGVEVSTATAFGTSEALTRTSGSASTNGAQTIIHLTLDNALTYAANKGAGWTITGPYDLGWVQGLLYAQWLSRDSQTVVGKGVVGRLLGNGYNGLLNGADDVDNYLNIYGTGMNPSKTNGQTPIEVNNICDLWGGCNEFVAGINIFKSNGTDASGNAYTAGSYRVTKRDGTGVIAGTLPAESYETGPGAVPLTGGYFSKVQIDPLGTFLFLPLSAGDANSGNTYAFCDHWESPQNSPSILIRGGYWNSFNEAGLNYMNSYYSVSGYAKHITARLKYIPQS